ncbi:hypothetical protein [Lacisediminimonas sp.]|uniref:hypothetical protein n=1 Tax=Lacisediminimonas sp. TaxID=3060582 RepID=UPI00271FF274|nr:hypothetical protein [Lacisediminimonas sp.]MDO8299304.1 hypothetical protein [Lacisediminimonas sp.]
MLIQDYGQLLNDVAAAFGVDAEKLQKNQTIDINGIEVRLACLEPSRLCRVQVLLGRPANTTRAGLRWMLECNSDASMDLLPVLAIDQVSGNLMLCLHIPLVEPGAADMLIDFLTQELDVFSHYWQVGLTASGMNLRAASSLDPIALA